MKEGGKTLAQIAEIFGLESEKDVFARIAIGNLPGIENIHPRVNVSFRDARDFLLPLRVETGRNPENGNERIYDYSEVAACIDLLVTGGLKPEDLPSYSAERRVEIEKARQDDRINAIAAKQAADIFRLVGLIDKRRKRGGDRRSESFREKRDRESKSQDCLIESRSRDQTAEVVGISSGKIGQTRTVFDHGSEETKEAVLSPFPHIAISAISSSPFFRHIRR